MLRRNRLIFLAFAVSVGACNCDEGVQNASGIFVMTPRAIEWGTVCRGETSERQLILRNDGNATLTILSHELKNAGGVFTLLEDLPAEIEGGEQFIVRLGFTPPLDKDDEYAGQLIVTTDAADTEKATQKAALTGKGFKGEKLDLQVKCRCKNVDDPSNPGSTTKECGTADGTYETCYFMSYTNVLAKQSQTATVQLTNAGCGRLQVNEIALQQGSSEPGELDMFEFPKATFTLNGSESKELQVTFHAPDREALPSPLLVIRTTDPKVKDSRFPAGEWQTTLQANSVLPALSVDPEILTYFDAIANTPLSHNLTITNTGTAPLKIDSVVLQPEAGTQDFKLELPNGETSFTLGATGSGNNARVVPVVYTASDSGSDRAKVLVTAGALNATVRLVGGAEPRLEVKWLDGTNEADPPVDFGTVVTGAKGTVRTVRLHNTGRAALSVSGFAIPDAENPGKGYRVTGTPPTTIAPAAQADVAITFDDVVNLRDDRAKLEITTSDPIDAVNGGKRSLDLVSANEPNFAPVVSIDACSAPQTTKDCSLDGSLSSGPEAGDTLTYKWTLVRKPAGSAAAIAADTAATTKFTPDVIGNYIVTLKVTDQFGNANPPLSSSINVVR